MIYFIIGAALGVAALLFRNPGGVSNANHPIQSILTAAVLGAAVFGTIIWFVAGIVG
jgi:hypothetical protein